MTREEMDALGKVVGNIVALLVDEDYDGVIGACSASRLSAKDLRSVIEQHGRNLVPPPENAYADLDTVRVEQTTEPTWSVRAPLWTAEEGQSDLTLELTMALSADGVRTEIEDMHVL